MTQYRREFIILPRSYSGASDWDGVYLIVEEIRASAPFRLFVRRTLISRTRTNPAQMSLDPSLLIGVAAGGAAGLGISYAAFYPRDKGRKVQVAQRDESGQLRRKTVTTEELERSKKEMRTLMLERDLLSGALTKVYEAENEGKITREEREMIAKRYSSQIHELESKLSDKELMVEVGELEGLRDELLTLFRRDREWNEQAARKQLVKFFEAMGPTDPLTLSARRRLSALMFS